MTDLKKTVTRRTLSPHNHQRRRLIVAFETGDLISFREERCRKKFTAPLSALFRQVVQWHVDAERRIKREKKRKAKALGL